MKVLRSREVTLTAKPNTSSKTLENGVVEPVTPSKSLETSSLPLDVMTPIACPSVVQSIRPGVRRRSLRLASKNGASEIGEILKQERDSTVSEINNCSNGCNTESSVIGVESGVLDVGVTKLVVSSKTEAEDGNLEVLGWEGVEEIISNELGDSGDFACCGERVEIVKEGKGRKRRCRDLGSLRLETQEVREDKVLSLRSGRKVMKTTVEESNGGSVAEAEIAENGYDESQGRKTEGVSNTCGLDGVLIDELGTGTKGDDCSSAKRRRFSRQEKGKGTVAENSVKLESDLEVGVTIGHALPQSTDLVKTVDWVESDRDLSATGNGNYSKTRISREEKGKQVMAANNDLPHSVDKLERQSDHKVENQSQVAETNVNVISTGRGYREKFRDIARRNASRFAHFSYQEEREVGVTIETNEAAVEIPQVEVGEVDKEEIEDWPGPFSTAMKIIRDREVNFNLQQQSSTIEKNKTTSLIWVPKKEQQCSCRKSVVPSLQDLCMSILVKNADAVTSLDCVPDVLRHKICQSLCDTRKMTSQFLELLTRGSPTEIRVRDCSWLSEEMFTQTFEACDTSNLAVLQLDQCGRSVPDYILLTTLAQLPNNLPALTTLSLKGACRLSDTGLTAIISAAPCLRSINLSQCSLLTCDGVSCLANSLGSVLKELYLDDCEAIDMMLVLPALLKLENLEVLSLAGVLTVCDNFIKEYVTQRGQNLREIVLNGCVDLNDCSVKLIAQNCPLLRGLDLRNLCKLTDSAIGHLATGCRAIDKLKLCRNAFSDEAVAAYIETCGESLKELSLNCVYKVSHNTAMSLAKCSKNLISLDLSWCRNLTNEALGLVVDNCLSLEVLKLFGCTQVTNVFVDGHSNPQVRIIGLKLTPILECIELPDPMQGQLLYSAVPSSL